MKQIYEVEKKYKVLNKPFPQNITKTLISMGYKHVDLVFGQIYYILDKREQVYRISKLQRTKAPTRQVKPLNVFCIKSRTIDGLILEQEEEISEFLADSFISIGDKVFYYEKSVEGFTKDGVGLFLAYTKDLKEDSGHYLEIEVLIDDPVLEKEAKKKIKETKKELESVFKLLEVKKSFYDMCIENCS